VRLNRTGVVAGLVYAILGVGWTWLSGAPWPLAALFVVVALVGAFIPGAANHVSLARAYLAVPAAQYAVHAQYGQLAVVVALAGLTDLVDGTVARRFGSPTNFGGGLDPVVDGVFLGALAFGLALGGAFPLWLALVVLARYVLPALAGAALLAMGRRPELRHTLSGQVSTTLNLVLLGGVALLRGLGQDPGNLVVGAEVALPIATLATFVHLGFALRRPAAATGPA
jgi:phosphatidylglycerophosphate synthase